MRYPILPVDVDEQRSMRARLDVGEISISEDDDRVALAHETGGRAVDNDLSGATVSFYGVGRQAATVVDVEHVHLLERNDVGRFDLTADRG